MKKVKLLTLSFSPFLIGFLLNLAIMRYNFYGNIALGIGFLFYFYWFWVGYKSHDYTNSLKESILIGNSFAIICVLLVIFQIVVLKSFISNPIGLLPQIFYLPTIALIGWLERMIFFFVRIHYLWLTILFSFISMVSVYYSGFNIRSKNMK
jgi:hypothetical protein